MKLITIYQSDNRCRRCLGWKQIANSDEGESWKYWAELPAPSNLAVQIGLVYPLTCPRCEGSGIEPSASDAPETPPETP